MEKLIINQKFENGKTKKNKKHQDIDFLLKTLFKKRHF